MEKIYSSPFKYILDGAYIMGDYILEMKNITKTFPGVKALDNVSISIEKGEIHALVGENGAGKSTLIKILNGLYKPDEGKIYFHGKEPHIKNTLDAEKKGLSFVFQEFNLVSCLSIAENLFLGKLIKKKNGLIDWKEINKKAKEILDRLDLDLDPELEISRLSIAEKQMVEIAKALAVNAEFIVMDEPSATLTKKEYERLFEIALSLKKQGITLLYISHRLEEVFRICDRVTVLRDGKVINTSKVEEMTKEKVIEHMVGRSIAQEYPTRVYCSGEEILRVKNLCTKEKLKNISFSLKKGEILGIAGLVGSGRTEIARAIIGADAISDGTIIVKGKEFKKMSPKAAKQNGIALLPEDRKEQGLALKFSVKWNISISNIPHICIKKNMPVIDNKKENDYVESYVDRLDIKTPSLRRLTYFLSGGNQQKTIIAKWLFADMDVLILDEPTRGIDVGAKYEIYLIMNELVKQGKSIIMISSELPEVLALSDRILVVSDGEVKKEFSHEEASPEEVIKYAIS